MNAPTNHRALRIGAACLLAVLALVIVRAPWSSAGESQPAADASASEAALCGQSPRDSLATAMDRAVEQVRANQGEAAQPEFVVLNNRGFNYGPPPGVKFDAHLFERERTEGAQP